MKARRGYKTETAKKFKVYTKSKHVQRKTIIKFGRVRGNSAFPFFREFTFAAEWTKLH